MPRATLNYFAGPTSAGTLEVEIRDGRAAGLPGWEECGFELRQHPTDVSDWADAEHVKKVHYPEVRALAEELSGADATILSSHITRNPDKAREHHDLAPITLVHCDFADSYGDQVRERYRHPSPEEAEALDVANVTSKQAANAKRFVILQFWRNVGPEKMDMPLAWCDARDVPRRDIRPFPVNDYAGGGFNFEALGFAAPRDPGDHHWYGFDRMNVDEVVAFRTFDTDRIGTGEPYWTPHSAFRDPEVRLGDPARSSIELRVTCLFL